ncbi:MAG: glycosyltransferase [Chitinophagaceae bacterium]
MHIAINLISIQQNSFSSYSNYVLQMVAIWCNKCPQHQFTIFLQNPNEVAFKQPSNCFVEIVEPLHQNQWRIHYWYHVQLPQKLKKLSTQVCIQPYAITSLRTNIPQIVFADNAIHGYLLAPIIQPQKKYSQFLTKKFLQKATTLIVSNSNTQTTITKQFQLSNEKVKSINYFVSDIFQPIHWEKAEMVKESYADAHAYYVYIASILPENNLMNVLKAFSQFKKWQKSSMKLLVMGLSVTAMAAIKDKLATYKYREDVVLLSATTDEETGLIISAAYGVVFADAYDGYALPTLAAFKSGVAVITTNEPSIEALVGDAALLAPLNDIETLAKQLIILYKDEILRSTLIQKGLLAVKNYELQEAATLLWNEIASYET